MNAENTRLRRGIFQCMALISGLAALSWEVLWQVESTLALGASAQGTALTLAATMGGMGIGGLAVGRWLRGRDTVRPIRLYAILELMIGLAGLLLESGFRTVERLDTHIYQILPEASSAVHVAGIVLVLGVPTFCMGATLPVFGLAARQLNTSIAVFYGLNTLGAAIGTLLAAFLFIPAFGLGHAMQAVAGLNIALFAAGWFLCPGRMQQDRAVPETGRTRLPAYDIIAVAASGFAVLSLEIAWFRSLTATFKSTTDAFAIMLASVLIGLGLGARLVPLLKKRKPPLGLLISCAGILALGATPVIERLDMMMPLGSLHPLFLLMSWFAVSLCLVGIPVMMAGLALPWVLDEQTSPDRWGRIYAINTLASVAGALAAGWILLPAIGWVRTAWIAGLLLIAAGVIIAPAGKRLKPALITLAALAVAILFQSGIGASRIQGGSGPGMQPLKILETHEGPSATVSAVLYEDYICLVIDGFIAAGQAREGSTGGGTHYAAWMGRLPMLLHPDPENALVIGFGTGQTANAVRRENPKSLDIVDINFDVFRMAYHFPANEGVLYDPRVKAKLMDGRAYIRRTQKIYDVITLEPMPPNFAGINALYSREFYEQARQKLSPDGVLAQWFPTNLIPPDYSVTLARTFQSVFPNAILWIDPPSGTGILLGSKNDAPDFGSKWFGFNRPGISRDMTEAEIQDAVYLNARQLKRYAAKAPTVTDDNQLLAYGASIFQEHRAALLDLRLLNIALLRRDLNPRHRANRLTY